LGKVKPDSNGLDLRHIELLAAAVRSIAPDALTAQQGGRAPESLLPTLNDWAANLATLSDQVTNRYFSHSVPRTS
jgi:hypothetical protein